MKGYDLAEFAIGISGAAIILCITAVVLLLGISTLIR
jgi:hypothetical protein